MMLCQIYRDQQYDGVIPFRLQKNVFVLKQSEREPCVSVTRSEYSTPGTRAKSLSMSKGCW